MPATLVTDDGPSHGAYEYESHQIAYAPSSISNWGGVDPGTASDALDLLVASVLARVSGTPPSTDNAIARYDGTTGLMIQNSAVAIDDTGNVGMITGNIFFTLLSTLDLRATSAGVAVAKFANLGSGPYIDLELPGDFHFTAESGATARTISITSGTANVDLILLARGTGLVKVGVEGDVELGVSAQSTTRSFQPKTSDKYNLGSATNKFNDGYLAGTLFADSGLVTKVIEDNVSNPPTDAELDAGFGTPAAVGEGFLGLVDDNNAATNVWLCASVGGAWWYASMTKAV